jgi:hypothetical protein
VTGDLVLWTTPEGVSVVGMIVREETGFGGGTTGWFRVLATLGASPRTYLARAGHVEILTT